MTPLVSCIMPTRNRRAFIPQAIRMWQTQTYESRELVILDDGEDVIADLVPLNDPRIRYCRCSRLTIGAKRNLACHQARGELIAHWDDDDWYAPTRISDQVQALTEQYQVTGCNSMLFREAGTGEMWRYRGFGKYVLGTSMLYRKALWQSLGGFPHEQIGEDSLFLSRINDFFVHVTDGTAIVASVHPGVTAARGTENWDRVPELPAGYGWLRPLLC